MTLRERIARRIFECAKEAGFVPINTAFDMTAIAKAAWLSDADAILAEMREATAKMADAALTTGSRFGKPAMHNIWQTMIDAAIAERDA